VDIREERKRLEGKLREKLEQELGRVSDFCSTYALEKIEQKNIIERLANILLLAKRYRNS